MWLLILFVLVNGCLSFIGSRVLKFSAFDVSPSVVPILVWTGHNPLVSSLVLVLSYTVVTPEDFRFVGVTLPVTILIAYLAFLIPNTFVLIILYHILSGAVAFVLQYLSVRYIMFILMNVAVNFLIARLYSAFF